MTCLISFDGKRNACFSIILVLGDVKAWCSHCSNIYESGAHLQKLQNRAARIITGSGFTTSTLPVIESIGWRTIELISNETKVCVFKTLNGLAPQYLTELFSRKLQRSLKYPPKYFYDVKLPLFKTANGQKCSSFRGVKYWNSLSAESKQAVTVHSFKASI